MNILIKKVAVTIPVLVLTLLYLRSHEEYRHATEKRFAAFVVSLFLLYGWIIVSVIIKKQKSLWDVLLQSSFYVYVFMVLTLTGYFILFKEVSSYGWWEKMNLRIEQSDRVNIVPFQMFQIYKRFDKQIVGNFIMLLPLGIYLPLLYKKLTSLFAVAIVSVTISIVIEFLQLITSYRSADIDDVILNTLGACAGFVIYLFFTVAMKKRRATIIKAENKIIPY